MAVARYRSIQSLRAFAALGVVAFHVSGPVMAHGWGAHLFQSISRYGIAGVDVFFVISGVVMVLVTAHAPQGLASARDFIGARLQRIAPLYWLLTAGMLFAAWVLPEVFAGGFLGWHVIASFLFLPARDATGQIAPVLFVGWTLNYEMLFYALFAVALLVTRFRLIFVTVVIAGLSIGSIWKEQTVLHAFYANPIMLEFVFGCAIGNWLVKERRLSTAYAVVVLVASLAIPALAGMKMTDQNRFIVFGLPAASLVWLGLSIEAKVRWPRVLQALGDASYSIYLTHIFTLPLAIAAFASIGAARGLPGNVVCSAIVVIAAMVGYAVHIAIERPLSRCVRMLVRRGPLVLAGGKAL